MVPGSRELDQPCHHLWEACVVRLPNTTTPEAGVAFATSSDGSLMPGLWNSSTTAMITTLTNTHFDRRNSDFAPPQLYIEQLPSGTAVLPSGKYRASSPLFLSDENHGDKKTDSSSAGADTEKKKKHRERLDVVNFTFAPSISSPSSSSPPPVPPTPPASPLVLLDTGRPYLSGIPDAADDCRDFEYATQSHIEEIHRLRSEDEDEDEQTAKRLVMGVGKSPSTATSTSTPRLNLRPRLHTTRMSNGIARRISWPLVTPSRTSKKMKVALDLTPERECTGCFDPFEPLTGLQSSCGHHYCLPCVQNMVTVSVSDESLFPPKCCNQSLMMTFAGKDKDEDEDRGLKQIKLLGLVLDDIVLKEKMESRWREWNVKGEERVYCSNSSCAMFLGSATEFDAGDESNLGQQECAGLCGLSHSKESAVPSSPPSPIARCTACSASTCVSCRQSAHAGQTCVDSGETLFWDMVKVKRWRQCPVCSVVIEKNGGCNIMKCPCGNKFTYENE